MTFFLLWFSPVCFKVFDVDHDGVLSRDELHEMVVALLEVWKDNRTDTLPVSLHRGPVVKDRCPGTRNRSSIIGFLAMQELSSSVSDIVEGILKMHDTTKVRHH